MELPCRARVNYRGCAVAVHRRLCYPHATSAAVVYGGRGYWTNGQRTCLTRSSKIISTPPFVASEVSLQIPKFGLRFFR